ncbi:MAG: hypothetical protein V4543_16265 [Bacteroidota bacterium]
MKSKQTLFFLVYEDIGQLFRDMETMIDTRYYKAGLLDTRNIPSYNSIFEAPNVAIALSGDWNKIDSYIILKKTILLNIREVPQRVGGMKFAVDQMNNPKSIELKLGGIYQQKSNVIVAGRIATISEDSDSIEMYKLFTIKLKKKFKKIGAFYVGPIAEEKMKKGWRLVTNENLPKEHDLALT